jgi:nicotinamidase-related amidase
MTEKSSVLIIVDMQNYYLSPSSHYHRYFEGLYPGCLAYLMERCTNTVIPGIRRMLTFFRDREMEVMFLRLCSREEDRSDLHRVFRETHYSGKTKGYDNVYPLFHDPAASVIEEIRPNPGETVLDKTTFSPFTKTSIEQILRNRGISTCIFTGLATSQCVETTARDASDRGFNIIHVEDAQADYDEITHASSLYSSRGVCGGVIKSADEIINFFK